MENNKKHENHEKIDTLQEILHNLLKKKYEKKLRTQANIENIQKKSENTMNQIQHNNLKNFIEDLSCIVNKLKKISDMSNKTELNKHSIIQGIQLIHKSLSNTIKNIKKN